MKEASVIAILALVFVGFPGVMAWALWDAERDAAARRKWREHIIARDRKKMGEGK